MGILLSVVISYAGINDAMECLRHIMSGMVPDTDPDFQDLVEYYSRLLQKSANPSSASVDWTKECGQGYLCLNQDKNGQLKSAAVKYYDGQPDSTAILFSTKISSFGQDSLESTGSHANGDYKTERYSQPRTKTIITESLESFSVGQKSQSPIPDNTTNTDWFTRKSPDGAEERREDIQNKITESPPVTNQYSFGTYTESEDTREDQEKLTYENVSDYDRFSANTFEHKEPEAEENLDAKEKLTWHYRPRSPIPQILPEIQFQSFEGDEKEEKAFSDDYLRSLDGIKFRPLQRNDPSGRRRSFKKRNSSSSTSSRESRHSREEELKMFTSLEEAEFESMSKDTRGFGSTSNLPARSHSRSRSRENSKERKNESTDVSVDAADDLRPKLRDLPKLSSFEEERPETKDEKEVTEEEEEIDDFWGNSGD